MAQARSLRAHEPVGHRLGAQLDRTVVDHGAAGQQSRRAPNRLLPALQVQVQARRLADVHDGLGRGQIVGGLLLHEHLLVALHLGPALLGLDEAGIDFSPDPAPEHVHVVGDHQGAAMPPPPVLAGTQGVGRVQLRTTHPHVHVHPSAALGRVALQRALLGGDLDRLGLGDLRRQEVGCGVGGHRFTHRPPDLQDQRAEDGIVGFGPRRGRRARGEQTQDERRQCGPASAQLRHRGSSHLLSRSGWGPDDSGSGGRATGLRRAPRGRICLRIGVACSGSHRDIPGL